MMFGLSNFIITEFLLIFYLLVTNVLYSYISLLCNIVPIKICSLLQLHTQIRYLFQSYTRIILIKIYEPPAHPTRRKSRWAPRSAVAFLLSSF